MSRIGKIGVRFLKEITLVLNGKSDDWYMYGPLRQMMLDERQDGWRKGECMYVCIVRIQVEDLPTCGLIVRTCKPTWRTKTYATSIRPK